MEERGSEMILRKIATEGTREKASEIAQAFFGSIAGAGIEYAPACWNAVVVGPQGDSDYQSMGHTHPSRSTVFEARYFQQGCEVHWRARGNTGVINIWIEDSHGKFSQAEQYGAYTDQQVVDVVDNEYLCWGIIDDSSQNWARLSDSRVGDYYLPMSGIVGSKAVARSREYLVCEADCDGNVGVLTELLVGFSEYKGGQS